jgi:hypothetical protein
VPDELGIELLVESPTPCEVPGVECDVVRPQRDNYRTGDIANHMVIDTIESIG